MTDKPKLAVGAIIRADFRVGSGRARLPVEIIAVTDSRIEGRLRGDYCGARDVGLTFGTHVTVREKRATAHNGGGIYFVGAVRRAGATDAERLADLERQSGTEDPE